MPLSSEYGGYKTVKANFDLGFRVTVLKTCEHLEAAPEDRGVEEFVT